MDKMRWPGHFELQSLELISRDCQEIERRAICRAELRLFINLPLLHLFGRAAPDAQERIPTISLASP
jgi:hypothetical protein